MFNGTIASDFIKLVTYEDNKKLDLIDFAATDFITLRNNLIKYIKAVYPLEYQNFSESDLGMMLIELVAYMGAILSMKADLLANENFLVTARNRNNVRKLLDLIGVKMKGPISAAANAQILLDNVSTNDPLTISPENRVFTISSPEDNKPLNYTLYKTANGVLADINSDGTILLTHSESDNGEKVSWTNLILLEGAYVSQTGQFSNNELIKSIPLTQGPVIEGSVEVYIDVGTDASGVWTQVPNLYFASGSTDNIFEVIYDEDYKATVVFGDGKFGRTPPIGSTYFLSYRVGGGTRGNIKSDYINAVVTFDEEDATGNIQNTSPATGGRDAETVEEAKTYAPLTFRMQDRLVTTEDFSTFANTFVGSTGSTGKAKAVMRDAYSSKNTLDLYVLQVASPYQLQQATIPFKSELLNAIEQKRELCVEVVAVDGLIRTLDLIITARIDSTLLPREEEIKGKLRRRTLSYFSTSNFDFGKPLIRGELVKYLFTLSEVRFVTVDNLDDDVYVDFNEIIQLNNLTINIVGV